MARRAYKELRDKMSPVAKRAAREKATDLLSHMPLHELRKARLLTQAQVAEALQIAQSSVAKIENQTDMYVSTLRRFIAAMGGELRITASFPDKGEIEIIQFGADERAKSKKAS